jgi:FkbM family methyltransferase
MDAAGALVRITLHTNPRLGARLLWARERRHGDTAVRVVDALVRPGDTALDIGANWGLYMWRLAERVGPRGRVYAFEPNPGHTKRLHAIRGTRSWITIHQVALSDRAGEADLHVPIIEERRVSALASLGVPPDRTAVVHEVVSVPLARLDDLLPGDGRPVAFIKCDVEGHEPSVLHGAEQTLRRWQPSLLIEIEQRHQHGRIDQTIDGLNALGYEGYALFPDGLRPLCEFDLERDQLAHLKNLTAFSVPDAYVNEFLFVRPDVEIPSSLIAGAPA